MIKLSLKARRILTIFAFVLLVFQNPLEKISGFFKYIDEVPAILAIGLYLWQMKKTGRFPRIKLFNRMGSALFAFVVVGLMGNIIYRYQPFDIVLLDILTNLKFYLTILLFFRYVKISANHNKQLLIVAKLCTVIFFGTFIIDRIINLFPGEYRYGIKSAQLFFAHSTYLAGACVFLIAFMTLVNLEKSYVFVFMNLIILFFTLRGKAIAAVAIYFLLFYVIILRKKELKVWQIMIVAVSAIAIAWPQIQFYFIQLSGLSARSVMLTTSLKIMRDYFPIGTGFGTYASHGAASHYSPVYMKYGFNLIYELRNEVGGKGTFFDDQFWPIIFGQTGLIGTILYVYVLAMNWKWITRLRNIKKNYYLSCSFAFLYLLISSMAEPAFNNSIAIPLAIVIGISFKMAEIAQQHNQVV